MSEGIVELRNRRPRLRSWWDDANAVVITVDVLLKDLVLTEILIKISFVVYSSLQRREKNKKDLMRYMFLQPCCSETGN